MINKKIIDEIVNSIDGIIYGSVEVIVHDGQVSQISTRIIRKTNQNPSIKIARRITKTGINII